MAVRELHLALSEQNTPNRKADAHKTKSITKHKEVEKDMSKKHYWLCHMTGVCSKNVFNTTWRVTDPASHRLWDAKSWHSRKIHYRDFRNQASQGPGPKQTPLYQGQITESLHWEERPETEEKLINKIPEVPLHQRKDSPLLVLYLQVIKPKQC